MRSELDEQDGPTTPTKRAVREAGSLSVPTRSRTTFGLLVAAAVGVVLRAGWLERQSYHADEISDRHVAELGWRRIADWGDGFPPLYYYVEKSWISLFGLDSIRELALIFGLLTWTLAVAAARSWWNDRAMLAVAWVAALSPVLIWMSQEMRPHSVLITASAALMWATGRLIRSPSTGTAVAFVVAVVIGSWMHYFFIPLAVATIGLALVALRDRIPITRMIAVGSAVAVGLLPLAAFVGPDLQLQQDASGLEVTPATIGMAFLSTLTGGFIGPSVLGLRTISTSDAAVDIAPWLLLLAVPGILLCIELWHRRAELAIVRACVVTAVVAVTIVGLMYLGQTGVRVRYMLTLAVPVVLIIGSLLSTMRRSHRLVSGVVLVLLASIAFYNRNYVAEYEVTDLRGVAQFIESSATPDAPVAVSYAETSGVLDVYIQPTKSVRVPTVTDDESLEEAMRVLESSSEPSGYWLVYTFPWFGDPSGLLIEELMATSTVEVVERFAWADLFWVVPD